MDEGQQMNNKRIKELAEQAGMTLLPRRLYKDDEPDGYLEGDYDYLQNNLQATRAFLMVGWKNSPN
jgi:hypothetical protein